MNTIRTHTLTSSAHRHVTLAALLLPLALLVIGCGDASDESSRAALPNAEGPEPSGTWFMGSDGIERQREPSPPRSAPTEIPCPADGGAWPYNPFQEQLCEVALVPQNVPDLVTDVSGVYRFPANAGRDADALHAYAAIPADEPFTLTIMATLNIRVTFSEYSCSVHVDEVDRTVRINVNAMVEGQCDGPLPGANHEFILACDIPALEAGTWTFERTSGPGAITVELPQTEPSECNY